MVRQTANCQKWNSIAWQQCRGDKPELATSVAWSSELTSTTFFSFLASASLSDEALFLGGDRESLLEPERDRELTEDEDDDLDLMAFSFVGCGALTGIVVIGSSASKS